MADWTTISDTQVDPNAPLTSELMTALRDNPIAIAQGASGATRITDAALDTGAATTAGTDWVAKRNAGVAAGAIGSYGFFFNNNYSIVNNVTTSKLPGDLEAGSNLRYSGADPATNPAWTADIAPSGTWRLMGRFLYRENSESEQTSAPRWSVYLRVS